MRRTDQYVVDGIRVPSVTEAMKIVGLGSEFGMVAPDVLETARKRGELVHQLTELIDLGHLSATDAVDDEVQGYVNAYLQFKRDAGFEVSAVEKVVVNTSHRYAGTIDRVGRCKKLTQTGRRVLDIKCVAQVSPATRLQVAGYAEAEDLPLWSSLQLFPNGRYKHVEYSEPSDKYDFLSCVRVAHFKLAHGLASLEDS